MKDKVKVHFLHIGKTGGTAIKHALHCTNYEVETKKYIIYCHPHSFSLEDVPPNEKVFFFVRDPVSRFISGFYSRRRKGEPRYYGEWSSEEKKSFENFKTPNELGLALSSKDNALKEKAIQAMKSIEHVRSSYGDWIKDEKYFLEKIDQVLFIGTQENLSNDFQNLKALLGISGNTTLPIDNVDMHKNPDNINKKLDTVAIQNIKNWYKTDYDLLDVMKEHKLLTN